MSKPEPTIEPPEEYPGGADSVADQEKYGAGSTMTPDLEPEKNPAVDDAMPDEVTEPDESQDEPTSDGASDPEQEAPA